MYKKTDDFGVRANIVSRDTIGPRLLIYGTVPIEIVTTNVSCLSEIDKL